jgi:hypothetical protein
VNQAHSKLAMAARQSKWEQNDFLWGCAVISALILQNPLMGDVVADDRIGNRPPASRGALLDFDLQAQKALTLAG